MPVKRNMKVWLALIVVVLISGIYSEANGQACCGYSIRLYVQDESGKAVSGAKVKMGRWEDLYWDDRLEAYTTSGLLGVGSPTMITRLKVSAGGYNNFEQEINYSCNITPKSLVLTLRPRSSKIPADFEELAVLRGKVNDPDGNVIAGAEVSAVSVQGERLTAKTNSYGFYMLELKPGVYQLEFESAGFGKRSIPDFTVSIVGMTMAPDEVLAPDSSH